MALITEQHSFQQCIGCCNTNFTTGIQSKQFQLRRNHVCCHFCISCCSSTATAKKMTNNLRPICGHIECCELLQLKYLLHVLGQKVNFLAIFVGYDWSFCGSSVSTKNDTILEYDAHDCCARFY